MRCTTPGTAAKPGLIRWRRRLVIVGLLDSAAPNCIGIFPCLTVGHEYTWSWLADWGTPNAIPRRGIDLGRKACIHCISSDVGWPSNTGVRSGISRLTHSRLLDQRGGLRHRPWGMGNRCPVFAEGEAGFSSVDSPWTASPRGKQASPRKIAERICGHSGGTECASGTGFFFRLLAVVSLVSGPWTAPGHSRAARDAKPHRASVLAREPMNASRYL